MLCAELVEEGFLYQSSFSPVDRYCSPERQSLMLNLLMHFVDRAREALREGISVDALAGLAVLRRLRRLGEELEEGQTEEARKLWADIDEEIAALGEEEDSDAG